MFVNKFFFLIVATLMQLQESEAANVVTHYKQKVVIQLYYESQCPWSRDFASSEFLEACKNLDGYIDARAYPYGHANTTERDDGTVEFNCQHGPAECYGNKLHACAIQALSQKQAYVFNGCMMARGNEGKGSDDKAADKCGTKLNIDAAPIKRCAKGEEGLDLLRYYGDESDKVNYNYVPYVLIDGVEWDSEKDGDFIEAVCETFETTPSPCI